jgi:tetratricopeptide (TPR) repeat protein
MKTLLLGAALFTLAATLSAQPSELGRIDFPTSAAGPARERFLRGVLLLHSFEYDDAAEEFQAAQAADPAFALAYWGEAMTKNHPIWMQRDAEAARKVLGRLASTRDARLAKAPAGRERGYLEAVEILFAEGEKRERDRAYAEAMQRLHEKYPADLEAQTFYALALLGTSQPSRDFSIYMKAAALAEEVFAKNPSHPGAVHYLIHSYDDPVHAPLGLRPARVYARIAPAAAHALHMPSHIFLALGMWDDVASSNEASWAAAEVRVERKRLGVDERNFHALFWLEYAYLQQGRIREAGKLLSIMEGDARKSGSDRARSSLSSMQAAFRIETACAGAGDSSLPAGTEPRDLFVAGFCGWKKGSLTGIASALAEFEKPESGKESDAHAHGGAMPAYRGASANASVAGVFRKQLGALSLLQKGQTAAALARAGEAAAAEDAMSFEFGPPAVVKPSHELLGELLLSLGRPTQAQKEFDAALAHAPGRTLSLLGAMRAATETKDVVASDEAARKLRENRRRADPAPSGFVPLGDAAPGSR